MRGRLCLFGILFLVLLTVIALGQTEGVRAAGQVTAEPVTSDQVAADFVRSLAAAVLPRAAERSLPTPPLRPFAPTRTWGPIGFQQIAQAAGIIFSGTVTAVTRRPASRSQ